MSVLEKKAVAFEKLAALKNEYLIDEILIHLEKLNEFEKNSNYNLSKNLDSITEKYDETFQKLAQ